MSTVNVEAVIYIILMKQKLELEITKIHLELQQERSAILTSRYFFIIEIRLF